MVVESGIATDLALIIITATAVGLVARQSGQPTIIAYILTGLLLGPPVLGVVTPSELTESMAELGLAFLLFLLGVKMRIEDIRHILSSIVKISLPQMALVCLAGMGTALLLGFPTWQSLLIGLAVMYSSTAVVIKMLTDKDEATTLPGKIDIGVLLVQDIVVVVLLALLSTGQPDSAVEVAITLLTILALIGVIGIVSIAASRYLLPAVFKRIANDKEVFFVVSLAWAFLFVFVSLELDLSIEMGAFLAGVALAQLPYSTELQDRITPLTDLFILIFFVSIGLQLEASELVAYWQEAVIAALVLMPVKFVVFFLLIDWQEFSLETTFLGSAHMIQVSEFALVFGAVALTGGFIDEAVLGFLSLIAVFTMAVSVYVVKYNHQLYDQVRPWLTTVWSEDGRDGESHEYEGHAVAIGLDPLTERVLPLLQDTYGEVIVIDRKTEHIDQLRAEGKYKFIFGDFRHGKVRKEAKLEKAEFVISSSVEVDVNEMVIAESASDATVFVEAERAEDATHLYEQGADYVVMSTYLTAEKVSAYIAEYFEDREQFFESIQPDLKRIERQTLKRDRSTEIADSGGEIDG
ncbi:potassium transporter Kef [Haloterrigena sp. H1]|uniref:cation:proton antiporter n=1 Tax=Haloterrigena sp. H1 TaxID=2552943 RepID=UPI00110D668D|nr:cation:proton antiporter [Haloterrigena sp. H1]TMT81412.1 potassium transporter Kef [Haloterrigena sp. H1]